MFRDNITKPIDPIPLEYVQSLNRLENEPDFSLTCLGIAMLKHRIENYDGIGGAFKHLETEASCVKDFLSMNFHRNCPTLYYYTYFSEGNDAELRKELNDNGFEVKENIGALIRSKANLKCVAVYHKKENFAGIFINSRELRYYHLIISFLSLMFPAIFKNKPLEDRDYDILKTLNKNEKDTFIQQIQNAISCYAVEFRRIMLGKLLKNMHEAKVTAARNDVNNQRQQLKNLENEYAEAMRYLKQLIVVYEGMMATEQMDKPEEELIEYLSTQKEVHNLQVVGDKMSFTVATLLNNYNENAWRTFSDRGYIYDGNYTDNGRHTISLLEVFKDRENRKKLLDAIFCESPEFAIKMAGNYVLNFETGSISTSKTFNYLEADPLFKSCMPNPHLKIFACLGGYETRVRRALRDRNYIGAIEMCVASAGSVDLDETEQTFRPFIGWLMMSREKVLHRRDGVDMTPEEALLYLIDKERENETN